MRVPNQFPSVDSSSGRIAIIGEAAGRDEQHYGQPFIGESGRLLDSALGHVGIVRSQCFVGNVTGYRPPGEDNDFGKFEWDGKEVQEGVGKLREDLEKFRPTMVLCLGNAALHLMKNGNVAPKKKWLDGRVQFDWPSKIGDWRGSLFGSGWDGLKVKCLGTFHPAAVSRDYNLQGYYRCLPGLGDLERLKLECKTPELTLPKRKIGIVGVHHTVLEGVLMLSHFLQEGRPVAVDIEGGPGNITCIGFSRKAESALVFPLARVDGTSVWSEEDETLIWHAVKGLVEAPEVMKIAQFGLYDFFALAWTLNIVVENWRSIELSWWESFAELDKGLDTQASILTKEQFYKPDREKGELVFQTDEQFWNYNGLDAAVTIECYGKELELLNEEQRKHFEWNCKCLPPCLYMMLRGLRVDGGRVEEMKTLAGLQAMMLQAEINGEYLKEGEGLDLLAMTKCAESLNEKDFARVVLQCLGGKNPRVRKMATVERWQPMRWKGKKWVKAGKMVMERPDEFIEQDTEPTQSDALWLKPAHKQVEKLVPFTPECLTDCEEHVLDSCREEWKRVKKIWKELGNGSDQTDEKLKALLGELSLLLSLGVNTGSNSANGDSQRFLYEICGLPRIYKNEKTGKYSTEGETERKRRMWEVSYEKANCESEESSRNEATRGLNHENQRTGNGSQHAESENWDVESAVERKPGGERAGVENFEAKAGVFGSDVESNPSFLSNPILPHELTSLSKNAVRNSTLAGPRETPSQPGSVVARAKSSKLPPGKRPSTDQHALDKLYAATQDIRALWVLQQRRLKKVVSDLDMPVDEDGRIRCGLSLVKDTGRMAASKSPLGTGANLMAWNKDLRRVCVADEGKDIYRFDLKGADSWTVACECAALGDRTMLEDLQAGLKPAEILCLIYLCGDSVNSLTRDEIKTKLETLELESWLYPGAKSVVHGSCYGAGWQTIKDTVLKYSMADLPVELRSAKPIVLEKKTVEALQGAFFSRYWGVKLLHAHEGKEMMKWGMFQTSTGHVRRFFGKKTEWSSSLRKQLPCHETLKAWLASKPQFYTTEVMKMALLRLWEDEENRREDGSLHIEPLIVIHDSGDFQAEEGRREWAVGKIKSYFENPVMIAGETVVIPADGKRGKDWGLEEGERV